MKIYLNLLIGLALLLSGLTIFAQKPELFVQTGHVGTVKSIAFSNDGKVLASGGSDRTIRFWDIASGRELRRLSGHQFGVECLAFGRDDKVLATGGSDKVLRIWDVGTGKLLQSLKQSLSNNAMVFSSDGKSVIAAANYDSIVSVWDVSTGANQRTFSGHGSAEASVFSDDGKLVAFLIRDKTLRPLLFGTQTVPRWIEVWDISTGQQVATLASTDARSMAFSPDDRVLASGANKAVELWDLATGQRTKSLQVDSTDSVVFSPDGKTLVSGGYQMLSVVDIGSGRVLYTVSGNAGLSNSIVFSKDGRKFATAGFEDRTIRLWNLSTGKRLHDLGGHGYVRSVAFNNDGMMLGRILDNDTMSIWDIAFGKNLRQFSWRPNNVSTLARGTSGVSCVAYSPDGTSMATTTKDDVIVLWDVLTGHKLRSLAGHVHGAHRLIFSPDGKTLASSGDKEVKLWDVTSGLELKSLHPGSDYIWALTFSTDGKRLTTGSADKTLEVWDVATGAKLRTVKFPQNKGYSGVLDSFSEYAFSPNGQIAAAAESYDYTVKLLDVASGRQLHSLGVGYESDGHHNSISSLVFSADGTTLVTGSYDGTIKLWDVSTGHELKRLKGHTDDITDLAFSADGKLLASVSADAIIKVWDVATGKELISIIAADEQDWLAVTPDGLFDGAPAAWSQILWRFSSNSLDVAPVEIYFNEFYYPNLLQEILAGKRPQASQDIATKDRRQPQLDITMAAANASSVSINERNVSIKIAVADAPAGAQDVRLFRNGSLVKVWRGDVLKGRSNTTLETTVTVVAGENQLSAYAFNRDNIKSSDVQLAITGADSLKRAGTAYILAVGVNEYANMEYSLRYAVADAEAFAEEMRSQQSKLGQYGDVKVVRLANKEATKLNILDALKTLHGLIQPEDALIIYFAGHGTAQQNSFYLIPHDLGYDGPRNSLNQAGLQAILSHSISDRELEQAVEGIDAGRLLLVIDACNSGQALEAEEKRRGPMNSKGLAQLAYEKGMYILTAAQSYQAAQEAARLGHGFLTYALVEEGLKSNIADREPKDGQVLLREWLDFATARVPEMQLEKVQEQKKQGRQLEQIIVFAEGDKTRDPQVQRPRVFYRREAETSPLVVARPEL